MNPEHLARSPKAYRRGARITKNAARLLRSGSWSPEGFIEYMVQRLAVDSETLGVVGELAKQFACEIEKQRARGEPCA